MTHCPRCGHHLPEPAPRPDPVEQLRRWCYDHGYHVGPLDRVTAAVAAALTGLALGTLRNQRSAGRALPFTRTRAGVRYSLEDIADFLELDSGEK